MNEEKVNLRGMRPSTVALFGGVFGAIVGLAISLMYMIRGTIVYSDATNSLIQGLLLGLSVGALSLIIVPVVYFAIGWVVGYIQGLIFNAVLRTSGGIELSVSGVEGTEIDNAAEPTYARGEPQFGERIERKRPK